MPSAIERLRASALELALTGDLLLQSERDVYYAGVLEVRMQYEANRVLVVPTFAVCAYSKVHSKDCTVHEHQLVRQVAK